MKFTIGPLVMGTGMILLAAAVIVLIFGAVLLIKLLRTDWNMSVSSFNAKFAYESSLGPADMEQDRMRRDAARRLGVQTAAPIAEREVSIKAPVTEEMAHDRTEEL